MGNIMQQKSDFLIDALHIFVLSSFAFAQPLFGLLSRKAEFFVARHSKPVDIIVLIVILCVVLPAILVAVERLVDLFGRRARKGLHVCLVGILVAVIFLPALKNIDGSVGRILVGGAIFLGLMFTIVYIRFRPVRTFLTVLSPVLLIFPGLFLFNSPVFKVVLPEKDPSAVMVKVENPYPIIMVVFDEFSVTSLMDEHHQIDPIRYPNFAALARDAYWFRNATTVSDHTHIAVPAMLTGKYPDGSKLPTVNEYPKNIFTLLGGSYNLEVLESTTQLCPERLCGRDLSLETLARRMNSLLTDLSVVYLHVLLPTDFTDGLPVISQSWKDFATGVADFRNNTGNDKTTFLDGIRNLVKNAGKELKKNRSEVFRQFIKSIGSNKNPTFYFLHSFLPHVPYTYLPSGKTYGAASGLDGLIAEKWDSDEREIVKAYQRYLLQVGFVDTLLGELIAHLKAIGLYERCLIIITADHGVSFRVKDSRRYVTRTNYQDIMQVPLFIKVPNQREGVISDRNVELIDILPTIADILSIRLPWSVDGLSALDMSLPERTEKLIFAKQTAEDRLVFEPVLAAKYNTLERKLALFGSGAKPDGLFKIGPHNNIIGLRVSNIDTAGESGVVVELDMGLYYKHIYLKSAFVPAQITGIVIDLDQAELYKHVDPEAPLMPAKNSRLEIIGRPSESSLKLALAVNGIIRAVTRTCALERGIQKFLGIVPESSFREGNNDIEIFIISEIGGQLRLKGTKKRATTKYSSVASATETHEAIILSNGRSIPVISNALRGHLDVADVGNDRVVFAGWAADVKNSQLPEAIVIFVNGKFLHSGHYTVHRPDVVKAFDNAALHRAGFEYIFPLSLFKNIADSEVRIFAVSKEGVATELIYPKGYTMGNNSSDIG